MSRSKNAIVFVNQSAGYLMIDIVNAFSRKINHSTLISGHIHFRQIPLDPLVKCEKIIKYNRKSTASRIITWLLATIQIYLSIVCKHRKERLFIVSNPPFAILLPLLLRNRYSLLIYDVYPDVLINHGKLNSRSIIATLWRKANSIVFSNADKILTISEGMRLAILQYNVFSNVEIVPVWTDTSFLKPQKKETNYFIKEQKLEGKFLVIYSGNIGHTHNIEIIPELARSMDRIDILFIIIGTGDKKEWLEKKVSSSEITNCLMLPFQPIERLPYSLSAADIGIVTLSKEASNLSVPSKLFDLMAVGAPILGIADPSSELSFLISKHQIGETFAPDQIDEMISFINIVADNKDYRERLRQNSLKASKLYSPENAKKFIH